MREGEFYPSRTCGSSPRSPLAARDAGRARAARAVHVAVLHQVDRIIEGARVHRGGEASLELRRLVGLLLAAPLDHLAGHAAVAARLVDADGLGAHVGDDGKVHFALFDAMEKQGRIWENETQIDTGSEAGIDLLDSGYSEACALDELAQLLLSLDLQEALAQLNEQQRRILLLLFIADLKPAEAARRLHCTVRNITKHRLKALDRLRELL